MGSRLILNVRLMKREMEASIDDREKSILHLPFTYDLGEVESPSKVVFANNQSQRSSIVSPTSQVGFELQELSGQSRSTHSRYVSL